jgi:hypothetical protein
VTDKNGVTGIFEIFPINRIKPSKDLLNQSYFGQGGSYEFEIKARIIAGWSDA